MQPWCEKRIPQLLLSVLSDPLFNIRPLRVAYKREKWESRSEFFRGRSKDRQSDELSTVGRQEIIELIADNLGRPTKYSSQKWITLKRGGRQERTSREDVSQQQSSRRRVFPLFQRRGEIASLPFLFLSLTSPDRNMRSCSRAASRKDWLFGRLIGQSPNLP